MVSGEPGGQHHLHSWELSPTVALGADALEGTGWGPCAEGRRWRRPASRAGVPVAPVAGSGWVREPPSFEGCRSYWLSVGVGGVCAGAGASAPGLADVSVLCSGLTHETHRKEVEQVYLRCAVGAVEWMYPTGALIVNLRPNTFSPARHLTVCIKPFRDSSGANIYLEKTGELRLLVPDGDGRPGRVQCFGLEQGGLFVEATPQQDIGRRTTGFQYELIRRHRASDLHELSGECPARGGGSGLARAPLSRAAGLVIVGL